MARAYRDGAIAYWRKYKPKLQSEGAPPRSTPIQVIFELTGIEIKSTETPDWSTSVSEDEIERACRYASHELNGFLTWFPRLFSTHPSRVAQFLVQEIRYELSIEKADEKSHYVLSDVSWSGQWVWDELAPALYRMLERKKPKAYNLSKLLKILQGSDISNSDLATLAAAKTQLVRDPINAAHWFAVWVGVDPAQAIPAFAGRLVNVPGDTEKAAFAMNFVTHLIGGRRSEAATVDLHAQPVTLTHEIADERQCDGGWRQSHPPPGTDISSDPSSGSYQTDLGPRSNVDHHSSTFSAGIVVLAWEVRRGSRSSSALAPFDRSIERV